MNARELLALAAEMEARVTAAGVRVTGVQVYAEERGADSVSILAAGGPAVLAVMLSVVGLPPAEPLVTSHGSGRVSWHYSDHLGDLYVSLSARGTAEDGDPS